ncbi:uncharacterized protein LOC114938335 isoform X2 [Nylanderia fulva]|uniref:uncharacterized protein LOC114938335 isoform X2 n=1 Tax=Nylanderia fulva TaxID=613905 RepID=UPI0010FB5119|nr:uncharacterized protein LOC114938335 isoform X2 [Nylanderia fulva]
MKFVYIVLIFIARTTLAELETWEIIEFETRNVNLNELTDRSIPFIAKFIKKSDLDPLKLPNAKQKLWTQNANLPDTKTYKVDLILESGILKGLSNLERHNNATLSYADRILKLDIGFEFKLLQATYDYIVNLGFTKLKGRVKASADNVRAIINITFNTTDYIIALKKLDLQVPSRIKVTVENKNGSVNWVNTAIVNIISPFFKNTIMTAVREEATNVIRTYLNEINRKYAPRKKLIYTLQYHLLKESLNKPFNLMF